VLVGDVIGGRLRIDRILGVGGFGVVAAATHLELRQEVAIKMLKPEFTNDEEIVDRFLREARAVAALRTEHVCRVFDVARTDKGEPYIVMELLHGNDVAQLLRKEPLAPPIAVDFVIQALFALSEAHPLGIVHRDLKPPNLFVMRRPDNTTLVKVLDFGIAKAVDELRLTHSSNLLGSPQYMSPEQINTPREVDPRTDIWSIGVTLYHMLARRLPFPSAQIAELCVMITTHPPAPIDIDPGLRAVIFRCLEKDRAARFQSASELAAALAPFASAARHASIPPVATVQPRSIPSGQTMASMSGPPSMPMPVHQPPAPTAPAKSRAVLLGILAASVIGVGGLIGYLALSNRDTTSSPTAPTTVATSPPVATPDAPVAPAPDAARAPTPAAAPAPPTTAPAPKPTKPATRAPTPPPPASLESRLSPFEAQLLKLEGQIAATPKVAPEYPDMVMSATQMSCAIRDVGRAKAWFAALTVADKRQRAIVECKKYNIVL
jgi:serine/threonine protein kinase